MFQTHKKIIIGGVVIVAIIIAAVVYKQMSDISMPGDDSQGKDAAIENVSDEDASRAAMEALKSRPIPSDPDDMVKNIIEDADKDADEVMEDSAKGEMDNIQSDIDRINTINQTYDDNNF